MLAYTATVEGRRIIMRGKASYARPTLARNIKHWRGVRKETSQVG